MADLLDNEAGPHKPGIGREIQVKIVLVCGDRRYSNEQRMREKMVDVGFPDSVAFLIEGEAEGADKMSRKIALELGFPDERILKYPANWTKHGRAAGPIRNREQFKNKGRPPDLVLAFHDDYAESKGTKDMVEFAEKNGVEVWKSWEN